MKVMEQPAVDSSVVVVAAAAVVVVEAASYFQEWIVVSFQLK